MSARDTLATAINNVIDVTTNDDLADAILSDLTSSGYRILGPDEIDAVTVEKCAEMAEERAEWVPLKTGDMRTAIRALCATNHGDK